MKIWVGFTKQKLFSKYDKNPSETDGAGKFLRAAEKNSRLKRRRRCFYLLIVVGVENDKNSRNERCNPEASVLRFYWKAMSK